MSVLTPSTLVGARSPIYITANYSTLAGSITDITLEVYIWNAARGSRPADPAYTLFRDVFAGTDVSFDIAPMVEEYIVNNYSATEVTAAQASIDGGIWWVQVDYDVNYINKATPPQTVNDTGSSDIFYSSNGYHTFTEGANYEYPADYLHTIERFYVKETNGSETVKAHLGNYGVDEIFFVAYVASDGTAFTIDISSLHTSTQPEGRVVEIPIGTKNLNAWLIANGSTATSPTEADIPTYRIDLLDDGMALLYSIDVEKVCEAKYTLNTLSYINRYGVWDYIHFFKASQDNFNATSEQYRRSIGSSSASGFTYDATQERYKRFNANGKTRTTLNTGWVVEEYKEAIKDLMLSERMLLNGVPVNIVTESVTLQKSINDRTINYTIEVEEAFDTRYV